jgi:hypothetical protein
MKLWALSAAVIPALLGSTAVMAQDASPHFALGVTGGITAFNLPSGQNGVLWGGDAKVDGTKGQLVLGETLSFSTAISLGKVGNYDAFMGATAFGSYANGSTASTQTFSGVGFVAIPGLTTPANGSISLTAVSSAGSASATTSVAATDPQGNVYAAKTDGDSTSAGSQGAAYVSTAGPSFTMGGSNSSGAGAGSALAYGAIADTSGSMFLAVGNLDGLAISTSTQNTILYSGLDITFGASGVPDDKTSVQAYAGPSYRYIGQWNTTNTSLTVDIPEIAGTITHPLYVLNRDGTVQSNYFGGVAGANISHQVSDTVAVSFGAEGSLYYANASLKGHETVRTYGGVGPSPGFVASPDVTVVEDAASVSQSTLAYAVRAQASATVAVKPKLNLTGTVTADYLSAVARPSGNANVTYSSGSASWASGGGPLSFGGMLALGGTVSLTGSF